MLGGFLVCVGALAGAFGTVGWMAVLCSPSVKQVVLGVLALGAAPVVLGSAMVWAGLDLLERESARSRVRALSDHQICGAAERGASADVIALRLGLSPSLELEARLDELVALELLDLEFSDQGELIYRARPTSS